MNDKWVSSKLDGVLRRQAPGSDLLADGRFTFNELSPTVVRRFNFKQMKQNEYLKQRRAFEKQISRSNFSLAGLDTSPRSSRVFVPDLCLNSPTNEHHSSSFNCSLQSSTKKYACQSSRRMNSNDPLNNDYHQQMTSRNYRPSDSQQIIDQNEIGRGSAGFAPPILSSPAMSRREFVPQGGYISAVAQPQHGKMLVDPQTGQQYFVATNTQPNQVAYYPVFYGAAAPAPPPLQQHVYYAHPAQPQWISGPMPSPPVGTAHQPNFFNHYQQQSQTHYPATTFTGSFGQPYHVEIPPSSSVSVCDERSNSPNSTNFQRNHESRMSTESAASGGNQHLQKSQFHSDDSMSPVPPHSISHNVSAFLPNQATLTATASQPNSLMEQSARYSTTSSTTSGFVSGAGESTADVSLTRPNALPALRTTFNKPKLYGAPEWWGEESSPEMESSKKRNDNDRTPTQASATQQKKLDYLISQKPIAESVISEKSENQSEPRVAVAKAIRMDIDLSRPLTPESKPVNSEQKTNRAQPTAFTVDFGNSENNVVRRSKPPMLSSQQEGALSSRRNDRRSVPPRAQLPESHSQQDPKHYLFSKMIQGFPSTAITAVTDDDDQHTTILSLDDKRNDTDAISEAGTYTIDNKNRFRRHDRSQKHYSDDASSTSSASSSTATNKSATRSSEPTSARLSTAIAADNRAPNSARSTSTASPHFAMRRSLMKDLQDLRKQQLSKPGSALIAGQTKARSIVDPSKSSRLCVAAITPQKNVPQITPSQRPSTTSSGFRRSDGGRFSMRSANAPAANTKTNTPKPPFRAGIAPPVKKNQVASGTPEMANWLRRKGYDPRKSVAEERKMQQLKERSENFFANRSISYNQPYYSGFRKLLKPIDDARSNVSQSQDDLSRFNEEAEDFYLGGSNSNLTKTVDELTQKCQRSMQLLKLCNPDALTESVEHLLDQVVDDSSEDGDNAISRLKKLNEAFGALQKCLEDSTSRTSSPRKMSATIKQRILSPTSSAPNSLVSNNLSTRQNDLLEEF